MFQKAVDLDPKNARAWSGVADCFSQLYNYQVVDPEQALPHAQAALSRALALDPELAEAHASAGYLQMIFHRDMNRAEAELRRALQLNANYATAHLWYGLLLAQTGRFQEATSQFEQAHALDPLSLSYEKPTFCFDGRGNGDYQLAFVLYKNRVPEAAGLPDKIQAQPRKTKRCVLYDCGVVPESTAIRDDKTLL